VPEGLEPVDARSDRRLLFGSAVARNRIYVVQADIYAFLDNAPPGYFLIGLWQLRGLAAAHPTGH
jgi:hypothetical protein